MTSDEILSRLSQISRLQENFTADGMLTVNTPTMSQSAGFELASHGSDSVKISVYGPFGITVGSALLTRNSFTAYNALNNTVYKGSPEKQLRMLPFMSDLPFEVIISSLQGIHLLRISGDVDSFSVLGNRYSFSYQNGNDTFDRFVYDESTNRIASCSRNNANGTVLWTVQYHYDNDIKGALIPRLVEVSIPHKRSSLLLEYGDVGYDSLARDLSLPYPDDAEVITIE